VGIWKMKRGVPWKELMTSSSVGRESKNATQ